MADEIDNLLSRAAKGENFTVNSDAALLMVQRLRVKTEQALKVEQGAHAKTKAELAEAREELAEYHTWSCGHITADKDESPECILCLSRSKLETNLKKALSDLAMVEVRVWREAKKVLATVFYAEPNAMRLSDKFEAKAKEAEGRDGK